MVGGLLVILGLVTGPVLPSQEDWTLTGHYIAPNTSILLTGDNICTKRET